MDNKALKRLFCRLAIVYWVFCAFVFLVAHDQFRYQDYTTHTIASHTAIKDLGGDAVITQTFSVPGEKLTAVELLLDPAGRAQTGSLHIELTNAEGQVVAQQLLELASVTQKEYVSVPLSQPVNSRPDEALTLTLYAEGGTPESPIVLYSGTTIDTGHYEIGKDAGQGASFLINGETQVGELCVRFVGQKELPYFVFFWPFCLVVFMLAAGLIYRSWRKAQQNKPSLIVHVNILFNRYSFLIRQLISRDFKAKYKRSVLGVAWSVLNPLLTMCVQYVVFSTLFQRDTRNYPVYLLIGIVFFNFFNEAINMGMASITTNASLIKKVYIPKYIFPLTRVMSSLINFAIALIPLFFWMLVSGTPFRPALFLLVFDVMCLFIFICGMSLLLSTCMTFFQDTKFLWSVVSMMWMYLTPIFYVETIIPQNLLPIYRLNPMYQFITFARTCVIDGVSPEPILYIQCMLSALIALFIGIRVFKKHHGKFIMYI